MSTTGSAATYGIFIEARKVKYAGTSTGAMHLYLVYRDTDDKEYVIRSGPQDPMFPLFGNMRIETNVLMHNSADYRALSESGSRYSTALDLGTLCDDEAWATMVKYARVIDAANTPYELFEENSNAFVGALLEAALNAGGLATLDPKDKLAVGITSSEAVGLSSYLDLMARVAQPSDGILRGTEGADAISGIQVAEMIYAGGGNDTVWAGRGDDQIFGGAGDDRLYGQAGRDTITGGAGMDTMYAGADQDRDVFVFTSRGDSAVGTRRDVIHEFSGGPSAENLSGDLIDLSGIDANTSATAPGDQEFLFNGAKAVRNGIWYAAGTGEIIVRGDVNGDGKADIEIRVVGVSALTADSFLL
jgi:hypothetical protein